MKANVRKRHSARASGADAVSRSRAWALVIVGLLIGHTLWQLRPGWPAGSAAPDADVVAGCGWVAWGLAVYLTLVIVGTAGRCALVRRHADRDWLSRLTPRRLSHLVEVALTVSLTAGTLGGASLAAARPNGAVSVARGSTTPGNGDALDWPGLPHEIAAGTVSPSPEITPTRRHASPGLVSGAPVTPGVSAPTEQPSAGHVVVHRDDTLWSIAARSIPDGSSAAAITAAWHRWYAANHHVIGDNPALILPGQVLARPAHPTQPNQPTGAHDECPVSHPCAAHCRAFRDRPDHR